MGQGRSFLYQTVDLSVLKKTFKSLLLMATISILIATDSN